MTALAEFERDLLRERSVLALRLLAGGASCSAGDRVKVVA
jgi:hypothetical protein